MLPHIETKPKTRKALYALSADPITFGHLNIVERVATLFDEVIFGIGNNPIKNYLFSLDERLDLAKASLSHLANVKVMAFRGMLTDFALEEKADVIVKGVRNTADFDYELLLHQVGLSQQAGIDTHVLFADAKLSHVSSSVVKAIQIEHGFIYDYVPLPVKAALEKKLSGQTIVGVTGAIAAGKTTLCQQLVKIGAQNKIDVHHINTDELGHAVLENQNNQLFKAVREKIISLVGGNIAQENCINRALLAKEIFNNPCLRAKFNELMLGPIQLQIRKNLAGKRGIILLESALLSEANLLPLCNNRVIVVSSSDSIRSDRMRSRGYDNAGIQSRNTAQFSSARKAKTIATQIEQARFGFYWEISGERLNDSELYSLLQDINELGAIE